MALAPQHPLPNKAELAKAASTLLERRLAAVRRPFWFVPTPSCPHTPAALQAERAEAASLLERRLAAIEALLTARRQVAAVAVEKVAEPALPDFMKPPPTVSSRLFCGASAFWGEGNVAEKVAEPALRCLNS